MREILFRGKCTEIGRNYGNWIYGYLGAESDGKMFIAPIKEDGSALIGYFCDPDTISEYTGLTANGKKIFEGDIVKVSSPAGSSYYAKIEYDCGCYWISNPDIQIPDTINNFNMEFVEVIGNIHDNFELFNNSELLEDKL